MKNLKKQGFYLTRKQKNQKEQEDFFERYFKKENKKNGYLERSYFDSTQEVKWVNPNKKGE